MFSNSQTRALTDAFTALQNRIANGFRLDWREHTVLVSVSVSDRSGNVLATIEPSAKSSSNTTGQVSNNTQFATGIALDTADKRIASLFEVAAHVWSLWGDKNAVVSATYQVTPAGSTTATDNVAQCFMKDGKLTIKHVVVEDRS